ncbi:MAG: twin-arginine translocase subunit TatB [Blastocatellia bacterium AA13]|nr:MAG: twin-arginine translocase subunit TatB [Blastocatellia bacterium AA13]
MGNLGWAEIMVVLVIALIVFGPRKLPELGKTLGQSLAQFRRASEDFKRTWESEVETEKRRLDTYKPIETSYDTSYNHEVESPSVSGHDAAVTEPIAATASVEGSDTHAPSEVHAGVATASAEIGGTTTKRDWA